MVVTVFSLSNLSTLEAKTSEGINLAKSKVDWTVSFHQRLTESASEACLLISNTVPVQDAFFFMGCKLKRVLVLAIGEDHFPSLS